MGQILIVANGQFLTKNIYLVTLDSGVEMFSRRSFQIKFYNKFDNKEWKIEFNFFVPNREKLFCHEKASYKKTARPSRP